MPITWTPDQVLRLAPDEASQKNASALAQARKWMHRYKSESPSVVWGEIQGSGAEPYQCQVDLDGPAYKCTCPSKKRPCKHALGLFLLFASQPKAFDLETPPDWVAEWLAKRAERSERAAAKTASPSTEEDTGATGTAEQPAAEELPAAGETLTAKAKAQARRAAERDRKIQAGLDDLDTWLRDIIRQGLASAQNQPQSFWETAAARLVDAQAPGLARMVRGMAELAVSGEGWHERLLDQMTRLYLAMEGYRRVDALPEPNQADIRTAIGFSVKQEELASSPGVQDTWLVLGHEIEEETGLKTQRVWLWGQRTNRPAVILSFAVGNSVPLLDASLAPGLCFSAELVYYSGASPLRALIRRRGPAHDLPPVMPGCATLTEATAAYASALASNPWIERYPLALSQVLPINEDGEWAVYDPDNRRAPLARTFPDGWTLLALSGGHPIGLFGIWNGERLLPLSIWADGTFLAFRPRIEVTL